MSMNTILILVAGCLPGALSAEASLAPQERGLGPVGRALRWGARSAWLVCARRRRWLAGAPRAPRRARSSSGRATAQSRSKVRPSRRSAARRSRAPSVRRLPAAPSRRRGSVHRSSSGIPGCAQALSSLRAQPSALAHVDVAVAYHRLGVLDAAFDQFSQAIALEPRNATAWDGRARLWRDWGLIVPALGDAHRARYFAPKRAEVLNTLGTILERAGQCDGARTRVS